MDARTVAAMSESMDQPQAPPVAKRPARLLITVIAVLAAALVAGGTAWALSGKTRTVVVVQSALATPTPTPSPAVTHLDERAACQLLTPAVQDGQTVMEDAQAHPSLKTVDKDQLDQTVATMQEVENIGPADLHKMVSDALAPLLSIQAALTGYGNQTIRLLEYSLSGGTIVDQCKPYGA